jgi:hypothetical protein
MTNSVTGFKAATHELKCRDHQFEVGQTYTIDGDPIQCKRGFHFCANPLDVWNYYPLIQDDGKLTRYMTVEAVGAVKHDGDKSVTASIAIRAELTLPAFIKAAVDGIISLCKPADGVTIASGYGSQLAASGDGSLLAASGYGSRLAASGYGSRLAIEGTNGVAMSVGNRSTVTGIDGTWVSLASYDENGNCTGIATGCIGKGKLKAGRVYRAEAGKFVEVQS